MIIILTTIIIHLAQDTKIKEKETNPLFLVSSFYYFFLFISKYLFQTIFLSLFVYI